MKHRMKKTAGTGLAAVRWQQGGWWKSTKESKQQDGLTGEGGEPQCNLMQEDTEER